MKSASFDPFYAAYSTDPFSEPRACIEPSPDFQPFTEEWLKHTMAERFEQMVEQYPNHPAVCDAGKSTSYSQLNQQANRIAHAILALRGNASEPVGLLFGHETDMLAAMLGVLKTGKFYQPLDPSYPTARLTDMLADAQTRLILTNSSLLPTAASLSNEQGLILNIDEIDPSLSANNLNLSVPVDRLAFVFSTSGSTGRPKGTPQTHLNMMHNIMIHTNTLANTHLDRFALLTSMAFAAALPEIYSALLNGASLYLYDLKQQGLSGLADWLTNEKITVFHPPIMVYRQWTASLPPEQKFPHVRVVRLGGEPILKLDLELLQRNFLAGCYLRCGFSSTETNLVAQCLYGVDSLIDGQVAPVGRTVPGMRILLWNEENQPVELGQAGEIIVQSCYLSPGYLNLPDLNAQIFLPDPAGGDERLYRTGDIGRWLPNGALQVIGRKDSLVKFNGLRIEIHEIETALQALPGIQSAAVIVAENQAGQQYLAAFYQTDESHPWAAVNFRAALAEKLPAFMIPSRFIPLRQMPQTATGKLLRSALPDLLPDETVSDGNNEAPKGELEEKLALIWEKTLNTHPIGRNQNFFELGGQSLTALNLFLAIEQGLGRSLPLATIFKAATIAQQAEIIQQAGEPQLVLNASHPPFFCMPGRGGNALLTLNLPVLLGQDHPFLILDAPGVTGSQPPFTRLEELGAYLVDQMKKIQPTGPYMLGGHSFGGIVAYEVAQQLLAAGDEVSLLVIFDTNAMIMRNFYQRLPIARRIIFKTALLKSQAGFHITRISTLPNKEKLSYLFFRVKKRLPFAKKEILLSDETSTTPLALRSVEDANIQAISSYQPKPYPGKITLFRASQPHPAIADKNRLGWGEFIRGEIEIIDVPGDHVSIFNLQNIEVLAAKLMRAIDQVNDEQRRK